MQHEVDFRHVTYIFSHWPESERNDLIGALTSITLNLAARCLKQGKGLPISKTYSPVDPETSNAEPDLPFFTTGIAVRAIIYHIFPPVQGCFGDNSTSNLHF